MRDIIPEEFEDFDFDAAGGIKDNFAFTAAGMIHYSRQQAIQHMDVARELLWHLEESEPHLAALWHEQHQREVTETGNRGLILYRLRGEMLAVLRQHQKYGFLAEWMADWMTRADEYRDAALLLLGDDETAFKSLEERVRRRRH